MDRIEASMLGHGIRLEAERETRCISYLRDDENGWVVLVYPKDPTDNYPVAFVHAEDEKGYVTEDLRSRLRRGHTMGTHADLIEHFNNMAI